MFVIRDSFHNRGEVDVVMGYIKKLLEPGNQFSKRPVSQSDIGVVAPYRMQCKFLASACRQLDFNDITVGTAEIFQGQERPIMIISTVRTDMKLGFVNDARVRYTNSNLNCPFFLLMTCSLT